MARPKVMIGIQARSTSTRLPMKAFAMIAGKPMLARVVSTAAHAARGLQAHEGCAPTVVVLTPKGDEIVGAMRGRAEFYEGPEHDVLARFYEAAAVFEADFIVRLTGDCPLLPSWNISRIVSLALKNNYDYLSNVDERFRTALDGADVEVFSRRMLDEMAERTDLSAADREHVTTAMRRDPPSWARMGVVINTVDLSWLKLSVDDEADLERVRKATEVVVDKTQRAFAHFGKQSVHII